MDTDVKLTYFGEKPDIRAEETDIVKDSFSSVTAAHIYSLFISFGSEKVFSRSDVMQTLGEKRSAASALIRKMLEAGLTESVSGQGKGKYRFKVSSAV
ncbi:MAG: hypothetical protein LUE29_11840 [Lachnospiraceae bacterium]|nr:hypothetical protein [Lachnospiraceae bacterium]